MKITVDFLSRIDFLPSRDHRKTCTMYKPGQVDVDIYEPTEDEFPVAFIVKEGYSYSRGKDGKEKCEKITKEIRTFGGRLYENISDHASGNKSDCTPLSLIRDRIRPFEMSDRSDDFTDTAVIVSDDTEEKSAQVRESAKFYLVFGDKAWWECGEPMYEIVTVGRGHGQGATDVFVSLISQPRVECIKKSRCLTAIDKSRYIMALENNRYFTAFEREKALSCAKEVAIWRGDTEFVSGLGEEIGIEVLMPEMVTRIPQEEHDGNNPLSKRVGEIAESLSCPREAAALIFLETAKEISSEMVAMEK